MRRMVAPGARRLQRDGGRCLLLEREQVPLLRAVERLVALQAQQAKPPFIGLWSRVEGFRREDPCACTCRSSRYPRMRTGASRPPRTSKKTRDALAGEGEALLRFVEPDARAFEVRFA